MATANIAEVFSGIQGEGMLVGERQVFVRFSGCNLRCRYCDSRWTWDQHEDCRVERIPGSSSFVFVRNPLDATRLLSIVSDLRGEENLHHSICFTGGEPLLQGDFLAAFIPMAAHLFPMTYLETNGTLPDKLSQVIDHIDIVSMDIKIPSTCGVKPDMEAHRRFLLAADRKHVFVKVAVNAQTPAHEVAEVAALTASVDRAIPLVIQPATVEDAADRIAPAALMRLQAAAKEKLETVRAIPQTHKMLGAL
ncbi:MAG: 7-carboxy-7-deazaguanine synthase QueE [Planctomycetes bacterium]|nr:7-carboxy-7-deazaguanine synthase QueE [Planctomycetota bacterium]